MTSRLLAFGLLLAASSMNAQDFLDGAYSFSKSKEAYVALNSGEQITGFVDEIKRKKGLISSINLKDAEGKKTALSPDKVKNMYLAPSGFDKLTQGYAKAATATRWNEDKSAHAEYIKQGYVFFETAEVMVKKKKMTMLLQLVNPGFAEGIKVYFNPMAGQTGGVAVGGIQMTGGDQRSFYFRKDNGVAVLVNKGNYSKEAANLFSGCEAFDKEFGKDLKWGQVEKHVFFFSENCR